MNRNPVKCWRHILLYFRGAFKPRMFFYLLNTFFGTQSLSRTTKNTFIYEICCLNWPSIRYFKSFYLYLSAKYLVPNFTPSTTDIGSSTLHTFISNDTDSKVVRYKTMIFLTHYLRGHIAWSSTCLTWIIKRHGSRNTKVC